MIPHSEKPAPGGSQERALMDANQAANLTQSPTGNSAATGPRAECLRLIERAVGPGGMRAFLAARQPALDDIPEPAARRKEAEVNRVLSILDELETEGGR